MQINPVIEKELKVKMRGWKSPALLTAYLGVLGLIVFLSFLPSNLANTYDYYRFNPRTSLAAYNILAMFQFILLLFITPAMISAAISGERERQTLDLLLCTNFSPLAIVTGKVFVSIAHTMLLIAASLPIMAMVFLFGGVSISNILLLFAFYLVTALMLGSIGIFYSTVFRKSVVCIIMTYITVLVFVAGTAIIFFIWGVLKFVPAGGAAPTQAQVFWFFFANPFYGFGSVTEGTNTGMLMGNIFSSLMNLGGSLPSLFGLEIKPWMANMAFNIIIAAIFILLAARKIMPVRKPLLGFARSKYK